jgi:hypothetical protein
MEPEERLDTLLSKRHSDSTRKAQDHTQPAPTHPTIDGQLSDLLNAADQFAVWGATQPPAEFAHRLETDLLARLVQGAADAKSDLMQKAIPDALPAATSGTLTRSLRTETRLRALRLPPAARWFVAVALVMVIASGALVMATNANSGLTLLGLGGGSGAHNADAAARAHLRNAQQALDAFDTAVTQHAGPTSVSGTLVTFTQQEQAAATGINALPNGSDRDTLAAQLAALRARARQDLRHRLPPLDWDMRADVTSVLRTLGETTPVVARANINGVTIDGNYIWIIRVAGADFTPMSVLLIDGQPAGQIASLTSTQLEAQVPGALLSAGPHSIGVGNADDTASIVTGISSNTPPDDHGGSGGASGSSHG